jgi:hypothetical protein
MLTSFSMCLTNNIAPHKKRSLANWFSRSTTRTFTHWTSSRSPSAQRTPCLRPLTRSSQTRTTCSCAVRKSARGLSVSTTQPCLHRRCASTTHRLTPSPQVPRTTLIASDSDARLMLEVALVWRELYNSGWVSLTFACAVCSPGTRKEWRRKYCMSSP